MITSSDFLRLPFTPDLTEGGIAYAIRSLPYTYDRMGGSPFDRLRRIVAGVAVELAFRRHLSQRDIPYDVKGAPPSPTRTATTFLLAVIAVTSNPFSSPTGSRSVRCGLTWSCS